MKEGEGGMPVPVKTRGREGDVTGFFMGWGRQRMTFDGDKKEKEVCRCF